MIIQLRTLLNQLIKLEINEELKLSNLKSKLENLYGIPSNDITFILNTKILKEDLNILNLNLLENEFLLIHQTKSLYSPKLFYNSSQTYPRAIEEVIEIKNEESFLTKEIELIPEDPSNFKNLVYTFVEMGFDIEEIIKVLRSCQYDLNHTSDILLSSIQPIEEKPIEYDVSGLELFDFQELSSIIDEFTNLDKYNLLRLLEEFSNDPSDVLQTFSACDRNYETTKLNLL